MIIDGKSGVMLRGVHETLMIMDFNGHRAVKPR
jgi:hypothetical protein